MEVNFTRAARDFILFELRNEALRTHKTIENYLNNAFNSKDLPSSRGITIPFSSLT